jgi:nickel-dependent lactate racemase
LDNCQFKKKFGESETTEENIVNHNQREDVAKISDIAILSIK